MSKKPIVPFRMGDVVDIKKAGKGHVVHETTMVGPKDFEYSTDGGNSGHCAWHSHDNLTLVLPCSKQSLKKLYKFLVEEGEIEE